MSISTRGMLFLEGVSILVGTIVGAGVFGLPAVVEKTGFWLGIVILCLLTGVVLLLHLLFAEIVLRTNERHRLPGYGAKYLGPWGGWMLFFADFVGAAGALLAFIILGGAFLSELFGGSELFWSVAFWCVLSLGVIIGLRAVARLELIISGLLVASVAVMILLLAPLVDPVNLKEVRPLNIFFPFGPMLFALWGLNAVPQVRDFLGSKARLLPAVVSVGTIVPAVIYALFVFVVVGIAGERTPEDALRGMREIFGPVPYLLGLTFGILGVATSFLILGLYLGDVLRYDKRLSRGAAYGFALGIPLLLYLLGFRRFLDTVSFLGAVLGGVSGIAVVAIYLRARSFGDRAPEFMLKVPNAALVALALVLGSGAIGEILHILGVF